MFSYLLCISEANLSTCALFFSTYAFVLIISAFSRVSLHQLAIVSQNFHFSHSIAASSSPLKVSHLFLSRPDKRTFTLLPQSSHLIFPSFHDQTFRRKVTFCLYFVSSLEPNFSSSDGAEVVLSVTCSCLIEQYLVRFPDWPLCSTYSYHLLWP